MWGKSNLPRASGYLSGRHTEKIMTENDLRDFLYEKHKKDIYSLIEKCQRIISETEEFPSIKTLIQRKTEERIDAFLKRLESLSLDGKEVQLHRNEDSTTRIDLLGHYECGDIVIIELKKSDQTERQTFAQLLSYANHFCTLFPFPLP